MTPRHLGIVAVSAEGAALCTRALMEGPVYGSKLGTETPLLIDDAHSPLPTLDSTRILACAALRAAAAPA